MTRDAALEILSRHRPELASEFAVSSLALFGSIARNESSPESDVDILVEFQPDAHAGLFDLVRLQHRLEAIFGTRVDLVMRDALKPQIREQILAEAVGAA